MEKKTSIYATERSHALKMKVRTLKRGSLDPKRKLWTVTIRRCPVPWRRPSSRKVAIPIHVFILCSQCLPRAPSPPSPSIFRSWSGCSCTEFQLTFDFRPSSESTGLLARVALSLATKWNIYLQCLRAHFSNVLLIFKVLNTLVCSALRRC